MSDGRCDHCEIDFAQLPGWRHIVRERPDGFDLFDLEDFPAGFEFDAAGGPVPRFRRR